MCSRHCESFNAEFQILGNEKNGNINDPQYIDLLQISKEACATVDLVGEIRSMQRQTVKISIDHYIIYNFYQ